MALWLTLSSLEPSKHSPPWDFFSPLFHFSEYKVHSKTQGCTRPFSVRCHVYQLSSTGMGKKAVTQIKSFQIIHPGLLNFINFSKYKLPRGRYGCCLLDWFDPRAVYNVMENCLQQIAFLGLAQDLGLHAGIGTRQETFWGFSFLKKNRKQKRGNRESIPWDFLQFRHCF